MLRGAMPFAVEPLGEVLPGRQNNTKLYCFSTAVVEPRKSDVRVEEHFHISGHVLRREPSEGCT
jgi:hypothetical protein